MYGGSRPLEGMRVAILATDGVEEAELIEPKKALESAGAQTVVVAPHKGSIQAFKHHDQGSKIDVGMPLGQAVGERWDALLLPGGALNADTLRVDPAAQELVRRMEGDRKPMAIICHAPWLLVSSGLVRGRSLTSYHTIQDDLKNAGATWSNSAVVRDGNWVTSREPSDIPSFNAAMLELFEKHRPRLAAPTP
jgi:protease I